MSIKEHKAELHTNFDLINAPSHYTSHPSGVECIDVTKRLPFALANVIKYVWRFDHKNGLEDLEKARKYLSWVESVDLFTVFSVRYYYPGDSTLRKIIKSDPDNHTLRHLLTVLISVRKHDITDARNHMSMAKASLEVLIGETR